MGQHLLQELTSQPLPVIALYHSRIPDISFPGLSWVQCDLLDIVALEQIIANGIQYIYHCAAIVSFDPKLKGRVIQDNITATQHIVNLALEYDIRKLIHVSSIAALGRGLESTGPIHEDSHWEEHKANSAYAQSKFLSEMEVWRGIAEGLNAAIINPGIILGEGDWQKGSAHLMEIVYQEFPWYTEGINAWVDVRDVVQAMLLLMHSDIQEERFIISNGNYAYKEVFTAMARALRKRPPHKKASPAMTAFVWRYELLKSRLSGKEATISRETAQTAQSKYYYSNEKFLKQFPGFVYTQLEETIKRMAARFVSDNA